MPESAIATGEVDLIVSPEDIAREISRISRSPEAEPRERAVPLPSYQCAQSYPTIQVTNLIIASVPAPQRVLCAPAFGLFMKVMAGRVRASNGLERAQTQGRRGLAGALSN